jgi:hypothetical protein
MKKALSALLRRTRSGSDILALRALSTNSYLRSNGWFDSVARLMPVDGNARPIPWYTYSAIKFLSDRIESPVSVFEYGSGNSTLWWAERAHRIICCEHDRRWHSLMAGRIPKNVENLFCELTFEYAQRIGSYCEEFDIVVLDGRDRVSCARNSVSALTRQGVIIWDNSDRTEYQPGYDYLANRGFRRIDFWGMGPINSYGWCTSVFYRINNCLGI